MRGDENLTTEDCGARCVLLPNGETNGFLQAGLKEDKYFHWPDYVGGWEGKYGGWVLDVR